MDMGFIKQARPQLHKVDSSIHQVAYKQVGVEGQYNLDLHIHHQGVVSMVVDNGQKGVASGYKEEVACLAPQVSCHLRTLGQECPSCRSTRSVLRMIQPKA